MSFYSNLLDQILFDTTKQPLVVIPSLSAEYTNQFEDTFALTTGLFPANYEVVQLPAFETPKVPDEIKYLSRREQRKLGHQQPEIPTDSGQKYLDGLQSLISERKPDAIFILSDWASSRSLPRNLKNRYDARYDFFAIALLAALEVRPTGCKVGSLVPSSLLSSYGYSPLREEWWINNIIRWVVEHNHPVDALGLENIHHLLHTATIVIGEDAFSGGTYFVDITADSKQQIDRSAVFKTISDLKSGNSKTNIGYMYSGELSESFQLSPEMYRPELKEKFNELFSYYGQSVRIDALVDFVPRIHQTTDAHLFSEYSTRDVNDNSVVVLSGRNISVDRVLIYDEIKYVIREHDIDEKYLVQPGDICVRGIGPVNLDGELIFTIISDPNIKAVFQQSVLVLRPKPNLQRELVDLLIAFLESDLIVDTLKSHKVQHTLARHVLESIEFPYPSDELLEAVNSLRQAEEDYHRWIKEIQDSRSRIFSIPTDRNSRIKLKVETRRVRQRHTIAKSIDDFSSRIRSRFPHPIAYRWKIIETSYPDYEGYKHILECAEVSVAYLASIVMMLAFESGDELGSVVGEAKKLGLGKSNGKTFGFWKRTLEYAQLKYSDVSSTTPFYEILKFLDEGSSEYEALDYLYNARNNDAHGEGPKGFQIGEAYSESLKNLKVFLQASEFLSEFRLVYIEKTRRDTQNNVTYYDYRNLMGDHHLVPIVEGACIEDCEIEANSLYLVDRDDHLHLLRPILVWHPASESNRSATFYLNRYDDEKDVCEIRSLELGDTIKVPNMTEQFKSARLLIPKES